MSHDHAKELRINESESAAEVCRHANVNTLRQCVDCGRVFPPAPESEKIAE